jgi:hypothetical protein
MMKATPGEHKFVKDMAREIDRARKYLDRAGDAADESAEQRRAIINFHNICVSIGRCLALSATPKRLRQLAEVLDGKKLRRAPHDDLLLIAYEKARRTGKRKGERNAGHGVIPIDIPPGLSLPFFSEFDAVYVDLTRATPDERLSERQVRRRLAILDRGLSKDEPRTRRKSRRR